MNRYNFVENINMEKTYNIKAILTHKLHAKTSIILDCECRNIQNHLFNLSEYRFYNKTYSWILLDENANCESMLRKIKLNYLGPNAQIIQVKLNKSQYEFFDIHSKGRHLGAKLVIVNLGKAFQRNTSEEVLYNTIIPIVQAQGFNYRNNFNGLTLRGATVIDRDGITSNRHIKDLFRRPSKDFGVSAFGKYDFELTEMLAEKLNFSINFRNARGWAGNMENSTFLLGFVGIMIRNEADIGASSAYNRLDRFGELDILEQSMKLETAFLFRFTPDLNVRRNKGSFFAPFEIHVWIFSFVTLITLILIWIWIEFSKICISKNKIHKQIHRDHLYIIPFYVVSAICQQGLDPTPTGISSRIVITTIFIFSVVIYNYYTSSLVGGLLSNTSKGPTSIEEITSSALRLSFEDVGYYKILFQEKKSPRIVRLLKKKILPPRNSDDLPVYTQIEKAIPYVKRGGYAFHCEIADAYSEISKQFDISEICDLRVVSGLMDSNQLNFVVPKNSQYTEVFRIIINRARESGLIERMLKKRQPKKPTCQEMYRVYPVSFYDIADAFILLVGGIFTSLLVLIMEVYCEKLGPKHGP